MKIHLLLIILFFPFGLFSQDIQVEWDKTFGGKYLDWAYSLIQTSDGGYALAGSTKSKGAGGSDFWLVKTDGQGNKVWDKTFGGKYWDWAYSLIQTSDGGYALAGYTKSKGAGKSDFCLVKTDGQGNKVWDKTFGGKDWDWAYSLIQTSDGGYALAGYTESKGAGGIDFWLVKTDGQGNKVWDKTFGGKYLDRAYSLIQTSDGGYALAGYTYSKGAGKSDFCLVKTDGQGNKVWDKTFGGKDSDWAYSLIQTSDGGYALAGYTYSKGAGESDFWLVKTDGQGNKVWDKTFGGKDWDWAHSLIQTSDGGYALAGYTESKGAGGYDFCLVKTDGQGNKVWDKTFGGKDNDRANSLIQTSDGGYALAGYTESKGAGNEDFWLVKTAPLLPPPPLSPLQIVFKHDKEVYTDQANFTIEGVVKTKHGINFINLSQNNKPIEFLQGKTDFSFPVSLSEGLNVFTLKAQDKKLNEVLEEIKITYTPQRKDIALLFYVSEYKQPNVPNLKGTQKNAEALENVLKENYGFETHIFANYTALQIEKVLEKYYQKTYSSGDQLLIYFSGHGGRKKYGDKTVGDLLTAKSTKITHERFKIQTAGNCKHILLVLDACYSGLATYQLSAAPSPYIPTKEDYLKELPNYTTRKALTSGEGEGTIKNDGLSIFTEALIAVLKNPEIKSPGVLIYSELKDQLSDNYKGLKDGNFDEKDQPDGKFLFIIKNR